MAHDDNIRAERVSVEHVTTTTTTTQTHGYNNMLRIFRFHVFPCWIKTKQKVCIDELLDVLLSAALPILFSLILSLFSPISVILLLPHARLACSLTFLQETFPASFHRIWRAVI